MALITKRNMMDLCPIRTQSPFLPWNSNTVSNRGTISNFCESPIDSEPLKWVN